MQVLNATAGVPVLQPGQWLVAMAAYGGGKRGVRNHLLYSIAGMCDVGLEAALVIDVAAVEKGEWERMLGARTCQQARPQCVNHRTAGTSCLPHQTVVRYHLDSIGTWLTAEHLVLFRANADRFDWFLYTEDDLGWTPWSLVAFQREMEMLRRATYTPGGRTMHAIPGFVRWEGSAKHAELNVVPSGHHTSASSGHVPLEHVIGNDLFFKLCIPPKLEAHHLMDGTTRYFEMCNPVRFSVTQAITHAGLGHMARTAYAYLRTAPPYRRAYGT